MYNYYDIVSYSKYNKRVPAAVGIDIKDVNCCNGIWQISLDFGTAYSDTVSLDQLYTSLVAHQIYISTGITRLRDKVWVKELEEEDAVYNAERLRVKLLYPTVDTDLELIVNLINQGLFLNYFLHSEREPILYTLTEKGYRLDYILCKSSTYPSIRRNMASKGYALDRLVYDEEPMVRIEVALQGYGAEILVNDSDERVLAALVTNGMGLDVLYRHPNSHIRQMVARQGAHLDILINDKAIGVKKVAQEQFLKKFRSNQI